MTHKLELFLSPNPPGSYQAVRASNDEWLLATSEITLTSPLSDVSISFCQTVTMLMES